MEVIHMKAIVVCISLIVVSLILAPQSNAKIDPATSEAIKKGRELNPKYLEGPDPVYLAYMGFACFTAGFMREQSRP
jgi:hypothetical protein